MGNLRRTLALEDRWGMDSWARICLAVIGGAGGEAGGS